MAKRDGEVVMVSKRGCALIVVSALLLFGSIIGLTIWSVSRTHKAVSPGMDRNRDVARSFITDARAGRSPGPGKLASSTAGALRVLRERTSDEEKKATGAFGGSYGDILHGVSCFELEVRGPVGERRVLVAVDGQSEPPTVTAVGLVTGNCYCNTAGTARGYSL